MAKEFREDVSPAVTEARRQALVQLLRAAGQAVDVGGSRQSLERLNAALIGMGQAYGTERPLAMQPATALTRKEGGAR
jgi:hypothetical protein